MLWAVSEVEHETGVCLGLLHSCIRGRAKGAEKASCGQTVVQKSVFGESVSLSAPKSLLLEHLKGPENRKRAQRKRTLQKHPFGQVTTVSPHNAFSLSGPVRDTPPYRAIPFRDSIAEGGIAPVCLVFIGYRASIAEIPLLGGGGVSHLHFACSPGGKR